MTAKQAAIRDIKSFCRQKGKVFLNFHKELDSEINNIVNKHIEAQEKRAHILSVWAHKIK